jgi:protein TonB
VSSGGSGSSWATIGLTAIASLALHAGGLAAASRLDPRPPAAQAPVEVEFEAVPAPPPPPPPAADEEEPPPPPPPPAPKKVAMAQLPPPPKDAPPPPPPPPNEEPPEETPPARAAPVVGLSLNSTVESGGFAVQTGNTTYGKADEVAVAPKDVKPYSAEGTAPPPRISRQPRLLEKTEPPYPEGARRAEVEGPVTLLLHIDAQGRVVAARVLAEPGAGLGEAARVHALKLRFSPALLEGEPVEVSEYPLKIVFHLKE